MAYTRLTQNQTKGGTGYTTVQSDQTGFINTNGGELGANDTGETVNAMHISKIMWSVANTAPGAATWTVSRGGNTVAVLTGSGTLDFQEENIRVEAGGDPQANVVFTLANGSGVINIKLHKQSAGV